MRRLLVLLAALAAVSLAALAWVSLTVPPAPGGDGPEGGSGPGGAVRTEQPELIATDAAQASLGVADVEDAGVAGTRAAAELEAFTASELVAFVLATSGPEDDPVSGLSVARARSGEERSKVLPELRPTGRPGLYELRWPSARGGIDLVLEADGFLPAAVGALMPSPAEAPRAVRLSRPASLAVRLSGYPQAEGAKVELFLRRDARRGAAAAELPWTGEGAVVFEDLPAGLASVAAVVPGAPPAHLSSIRLLEGARTVVELDAPRGESVRGAVVELGTERPLAGVRVELQPLVSGLSDREERAPFDAVVTAGDGRFSFDGAPVGKARALLTTEDGVRVHRDFVIIEGNGARELSLRVQPSASLAGRVLGRPEDLEGLELAVVASGDAGRVVGSAISGRPMARRSGVSVEVGADGSFAAERVPAGRQLLLLARVAGTGAISSLEIPARLRPGERREGVELVLREPPMRSFVVTDRGDRPIERIEVRFEERLAGGTAWTDGIALDSASGRYQVTGRAHGARRIRVDAEGFTAVTTGWREGEVPAIRMRGRRDVHVVVLDDLGRALDRARVRALADDEAPSGKKRRGGPEARDGCDRYGRAALDLDPEHRWRLMVSADGHHDAGPFFVERTDDVPREAPLLVRLQRSEEPELGVVRGEIVRAGTGGPIFDLEFTGLRGGTWRVDGTAFELRGLRPGKFDIRATSGGFETASIPVRTLGAGEEVDVGVIRVRPATRVEVSVLDHLGRRPRGLRVRLFRLPVDRGGRDDLPRRVELDEDPRRRGSFQATGVGRANWRLVVEQGRKRLHSRTVSLTQTRQAIRVELPAPGTPGSKTGG